MQASKIFTVWHHGTSGRWYAFGDSFLSLADALTFAAGIKNEGYGVRITAGTELIKNAPWQETLE